MPACGCITDSGHHASSLLPKHFQFSSLCFVTDNRGGGRAGGHRPTLRPPMSRVCMPPSSPTQVQAPLSRLSAIPSSKIRRQRTTRDSPTHSKSPLRFAQTHNLQSPVKPASRPDWHLQRPPTPTPGQHHCSPHHPAPQNTPLLPGIITRLPS